MTQSEANGVVAKFLGVLGGDPIPDKQLFDHLVIELLTTATAIESLGGKLRSRQVIGAQLSNLVKEYEKRESKQAK